MDKTRWERVGAASGILAIVLVIAGIAIVPAPPHLSDLAKTASYTAAHRKGLLIQSYLLTLAAGFLVWFAGSVRAHMRRNEGEPGRLAEVGFGGALVGIGLFMLSALMLSVQAFRADSVINTGNLQLVVDVGAIAFAMMFVPFSVWAGATAVASYRNDAFPRAYSVVTGVAALVMGATPLLMLGHTGFFSIDSPTGALAVDMLGLLAWTLATSVLLIVGEAEAGEEADATIITHEHWHLRRASGQ